jgi:hypothetical protein
MPWPTADDLLAAALEQADLAYQFAPSSYTFHALAAIYAAIEECSAEEVARKFVGRWRVTPSARKATPGKLPIERVRDESGFGLATVPANRLARFNTPSSAKQNEPPAVPSAQPKRRRQRGARFRPGPSKASRLAMLRSQPLRGNPSASGKRRRPADWPSAPQSVWPRNVA